MAILKSEDQDTPTSLELNLKRNFNDEWLGYEIVLDCKGQKEVYNNMLLEEKNPSELNGKFVFALKPQNRLELFIKLIENFLDDEKQKELVFEPADPSFELILRRSHADGFQAYIWVDSGNTDQLVYTWDAKGIRFFTSKDHIASFVSELKEEAKSKCGELAQS